MHCQDISGTTTCQCPILPSKCYVPFYEDQKGWYVLAHYKLRRPSLRMHDASGDYEAAGQCYSLLD